MMMVSFERVNVVEIIVITECGMIENEKCFYDIRFFGFFSMLAQTKDL